MTMVFFSSCLRLLRCLFLGLAAYIGLIHFNRVLPVSSNGVLVLFLHRNPQTVKHEPCRLLSDTDGLSDLVAD